jgi:hypothetical protein
LRSFRFVRSKNTERHGLILRVHFFTFPSG